jgi:hypothetical protein
MDGITIGELMILRCMIVVAVVLAVLPATAKEARPPHWSRDVLDTFFDDAREKLVGARPDYERQAAESQGSAAETTVVSTGTKQTEFAWSKLIAAETLEAEVKRAGQTLAAGTTSPSQFKGGGYKDARRSLSELAVLFAVTAQYDGDARWKDVAAGLRDTFAKSAANAKTGTDESFRMATARRDELAELVRGGRPQVAKAMAVVADWSQVAARPPIMQRINLAHQERLTKWLADPAAFRRNQNDAAHEAQVVAMLAEVIHREAFEFSDDETYVGYAHDLEQAMGDVSAATGAGNFEPAREALGRASKACVECHAGYRG